MSKLRSAELRESTEEAIPDDTALFLIAGSVSRRRSLIYGKLHDGYGDHCAIGCFFDDNPKATLHSALIDEVAAVNDAVPASATPQERWKKVRSWLRWKLKVMAAGNKAA